MRRRSRLAIVVTVGAGLLPAAPGPLAATSAAARAPVPAPAPVTSIVSGSAAGPSSTFSEVIATANCGGPRVSGGGTRLAQTTRIVTHNGIHLDGSFPSPDGATQAANGAIRPTRWVAAGGSGGGVPDDAQTLAYGVCILAGPTATKVVAASSRGPTGTFQMVHATATCPAKTRLLSGGARATPGVVGSLKPNGSFPSNAAGTPMLAGTDPSSWTVSGLNGGGGDQGNTTYAFALCATAGAPLRVTVIHSEVPGPALATTPAQTTATCPAGTALLGGGGFISDAFGLPGSQGDHLTGSYPSDARGTPVASGPAASWTAASHTGGVDSGSLTQTDAWALCANSADAPPPALGPAVPAYLAGPSITGATRVGRTLYELRGSWTNAPTSYTYQWLRCSYSGNTCTAIRGARRGAYRLTSADIGSRIRVEETASDAVGPSAPAVSAVTAAIRGGRISTGQVRAELRRQIVPRGRETQIATMLVRGDTVLAFTALEAGRAVVAWYLPGKHPTLVARGTGRFRGARATTIDVRLTVAGNRALNAARRLRLTAQGTFTPSRRRSISVTKKFVLTR